MNWLPIETVPKNGAKVVLFEDGDIFAGAWVGDYWEVYCGQPVVYQPDPSHWTQYFDIPRLPE